MFNFDIEKVAKQAVTAAKFFNSMIVIDSVRKAADSVVDAQAEFARSVYSECDKFAKKSVGKTAE